MTKERKEAFKQWGLNLLKFSAPGLAAFFGQLALGADFKVAGLTGLLVLWGALADFFKKFR